MCAWSAAGASARFLTAACSSSGGSRPLARARLAASAASTASWQVKALVEATPISGPAYDGNSRSASRAMLLVGTLTTTAIRSEEHTSELQSLMRISYAVFCLKKKKYKTAKQITLTHENTTNRPTIY